MPWRVEISPAARRDLLDAPRPEQRRIGHAIDLLAENPRPPGAVALVGGKGTWRVRVGNRRIVYELRDGELRVWGITVAHRRHVYEIWRRRTRGR